MSRKSLQVTLLLICALFGIVVVVRLYKEAPAPVIVVESPRRLAAGSESFPSTFLERWKKAPIGPQTTWWRALTFVDPDLHVYTIFDSNDPSKKLESTLSFIAEKYNLNDDQISAANNIIRDKFRRWKIASDEFVETLVEASALPNVTVQSEFGLVLPCFSRRATKSFGSLESLRTLTEWPEEVVLAMGISPEVSTHAWDYSQVATLVTALFNIYADLVPSGASLKAVLFEPDGGPWSSRLFGIKQMKKAKVVAAIDNDDYLMPDVIKELSYIFRKQPDLDYVLGGGANINQLVPRKQFFQEILIPAVVMDKDEKFSQAKLDLILDRLGPRTFEYAREQYNFTRRYSWYLGSIVGLPNLGVQRDRYRLQPYIKLFEQLRSRISNLSREGRLPDTPLDELNQGYTYNPHFLAHREIQDQMYIEAEIADGYEQDWDVRCNNGWSAGRREVYEHFIPPIYQWQGEDSSYSFVLYQSGLNTACLPIALAAYWQWDSHTVFDH